MCLILYLASDSPLPTSTWSQDAQAPYIGSLSAPDEAPLRPHFQKRHIYYVGSDTNCGCGFDYNSQYPDPVGEDADCLASRQWLVEVAHEALRHQESIEIMACWSGDEDEEIIERKQVHPDDLADRRVLDEGYLLLVTSSGA